MSELEFDQKIKKQSTVDLVFEQIKARMLRGAWSIGERLPSESDLANMFHVNRLTIRMALQKLNVLGLVKTRAGEGTFVIKFDFNEYMTQVSEFYTDKEFDDIADFRKGVELECCRLAMERATPEELIELKRLSDAFVEIGGKLTTNYSHDDYLAFVAADITFHRYICEISHNSLLYKAFIMSQSAIYQHLLMIVEKRMKMHEEGRMKDDMMMAEIHLRIYEAIINKDFKACKESYLLMVNHHINIYE